MALFIVGSKVKWKSQAAGSWVVKVGEVLEVVPDGKSPKTYRHTGRRKNSVGGQSYVIDAQPVQRKKDGTFKLGKKQRYWPLSSVLMAWNGDTSSTNITVP